MLKRKLVRTAEAATILSVAEATLRSWRARGKGPKFEGETGPGGCVLYDVAELRRWAKQPKGVTKV